MFGAMANPGRLRSTRLSQARRLLAAISYGMLLLFSASMVRAEVGSAASGDCDSGLKQPEGSPPNAYAQRKGRCEGIYAREIAAANLGIASFTKQFDDFDAKAADAIRLDWRTPAHNVVHLRAVSLKPRFYYRMDASRAAGEDSWLWPTDVLTALGIDPTGLGLLASTTIPLNGVDRVIYLPLQISTNGAAQAPHPFKLLLRSDVEMSEVFISIAELDQQGKPITFVRQNKPLLYGIYPAERGIPVYLGPAELRQSTIYQVEVGATLRTGGSANIRFWIYGGD